MTCRDGGLVVLLNDTLQRHRHQGQSQVLLYVNHISHRWKGKCWDISWTKNVLYRNCNFKYVFKNVLYWNGNLNTDSFTCLMQHNSCSFLGQVLAHFIMMGFNFFQICMIIQPTTDSHFFHTEAISTLLPNNKAKGHSNVKELEKSILSLEK